MIFMPLIHCLPPEVAHRLGLWALKCGALPAAAPVMRPELQMKVLGLSFANPVGLAAGFDKNAEAVNALFDQGFGFVEAGTVTPLPQPGNPRPRLFRLKQDAAVINRLGFNNRGLAVFLDNFRRIDKSKGIAGANIGKNKNATDAVADYVTGLQAVYPHADYVTINISSPNTQGLRALQQREALSELLSALDKARGECLARSGKSIPMLLKVAPDLTAAEREDVADMVLAHGIDGIVVSNTTIARPASLRSRHAHEAGGLSGRPLFAPSTEALRDFYRLTGGRLPLVGVGGIASAQDAYAKIRAGASLVQLYTGLVYQGFGLVRDIQAGLTELLKRDGFSQLHQAVGVDAVSNR